MPAEILGEIEQHQSTEIHVLRADLLFIECRFWCFYLEGRNSATFGRIDTKMAKKKQVFRIIKCSKFDRKRLRRGLDMTV